VDKGAFNPSDGGQRCFQPFWWWIKVLTTRLMVDKVACIPSHPPEFRLWRYSLIWILATASCLIRCINFVVCVMVVVSVNAMKLCGRWRLRLVVNFRLRPFRRRRASPSLLYYGTFGESQSRSGRFGVEINLLPFLGMEWRFRDRRIPSLVTVPTELFVFSDTAVWKC